MAALNSSWPEPWNKAARPPAKMATKQAPTTPPATPMETQSPRPGTPLVAASTMPTIRPASMTSRKTISSVPSMGRSPELTGLLRRHHALGGGRVVFAHEGVATGA